MFDLISFSDIEILGPGSTILRKDPTLSILLSKLVIFTRKIPITSMSPKPKYFQSETGVLELVFAELVPGPRFRSSSGDMLFSVLWCCSD